MMPTAKRFPRSLAQPGDGRSDSGVNDPVTRDWYLYKSMEGFSQVNY